MKSFIIFLAIFFAAITAVAQSFTPTEEYDLHTHIIYFDCNSSEISAEQAQELDKLIYNIVSIDAYASVDGSTEHNQALSLRRLEAVCTALETGELFGAAHGETAQFGSKSANRCVVVTYAVLKNNNTTDLGVTVDTVVTNNTAPVDPSGFTCGQRKNPGSYFFSNPIVEEMKLDSPSPVSSNEPIILTNVGPSFRNDSLALSIEPVKVDTLFLPVKQAVRFQMQKNGMSRSEAIKSIAARKSQWKELEPKNKAKAPKKAKARKVNMKQTRGACRRGLIRFIPNIGC